MSTQINLTGSMRCVIWRRGVIVTTFFFELILRQLLSALSGARLPLIAKRIFIKMARTLLVGHHVVRLRQTGTHGTITTITLLVGAASRPGSIQLRVITTPLS